MKRFDKNPQDAAIKCAERGVWDGCPEGLFGTPFSDTCNKKHVGRRRAWVSFWEMLSLRHL